MLQTKPKKRPKPKLDSVVERAIRAACDEFERALVAEWDANADSAKIRNAIRVLPNRCRQCGKPVAGIGDLCVCKTKIDYERFLSNPQNEFRKLFQQRCGGIAASASLAKFVETIGGIAVANDRDLNWVEEETLVLLPSLKCAFRKWVIGICGLPFMHTGMLPEWFKDEQDIIPEVELQRSLSTEDTERELVELESEIGQCFEKAKKAALDQASLQMARAVRVAPKRVPARRARQNLIAAMVARIKRDNPEASIERICQILDLKRCPLRVEDKNAGFKSWHAAWANARRRNSIKRFISHIQPAAAEKKG
jgi:hypothetical protein